MQEGLHASVFRDVFRDVSRDVSRDPRWCAWLLARQTLRRRSDNFGHAHAVRRRSAGRFVLAVAQAVARVVIRECGEQQR